MIKEAIEFILARSQATTFDITDALGRPARYSDKPLHEVQAAAPPEPGAVPVFTLAGFADLVGAKLEDKNFPADFVIHIHDERTVTLQARVSDVHGRRLTLIKAQPVPFQAFRFGQWMPQEEFVIAVASLFADTADRAYVLGLAGSLTNEATRTSEDDGFSQKATVKAGLAQKAVTTIKPRVSLAPYRTFPEIEQPASDFVLRARTDGDGVPTLALFEADGGAWKLQAIQTIHAAMAHFELGVPIIA